MSLSTHVLDAVTGRPAAGLPVELIGRVDGERFSLGSFVTDRDGRISDVSAPEAGIYELRFDTGAYFGRLGVATFYPDVTVAFVISDQDAHHHVPLLLSPFSYSTYRGS